ncbi:MAG: phosphoribosylformylglycinamidine cyclo-ligase [bacterium]
MDYKKAGVDIEAGKKAVLDITSMVKSTYTKGAIDNFGLFGSLFSIGELNYKNPVLVSGTDGVGTKLKIAFAANKHNTIGIDLAAMSINDIACLGAKPLFFLDYISTSNLKPDIIKEIVSGIVEGCKIAKCSLLGGEMAEMPSFYQSGEYDLAGFAVGIVEKDEIINGTDIKEGDKVIGIASSGLHSNGYSLARKIIFDMMALGIDDTLLSDGRTVKDALLEPTIIYSELIRKLKSKFKIKGIAHITGGGLPENLIRIIPANTIAEVDKHSWEAPELFRLLKEKGKLDENEFYRVFNAGIGLVLVLNGNIANEAVALINETEYINSSLFNAYEIGNIVCSKKSSKDAEVVLI